MRYEDVECPYCNTYQEICHDDGFGYEENVRHEDKCEDCGKRFVFTTSMSFSYEGSKADCLNGGEHAVNPTNTYPVRCTMMACDDCDYRRSPTAEEMKEIKRSRE